RVVHLRRDVDDHRAPYDVRTDRGEPNRGHAAPRDADNAVGTRRELLERGGDGDCVVPRAVVAVVATVGAAVTREVDRQRRSTECEHDAVPGVRVLTAAVEED